MHRRAFVASSLLTLPLTARRLAAAPMPVVLELFTSQGCSSCPPADALLGRLRGEPGVIALAWHVDYWNSLGWHDRFSRPEWTARQKSYASQLNEEVYTPALVINGAAMVVGSDQSAVRRAIAAVPPPSVPVTLRRGPSGLTADIGAIPEPATGLLVIYDPEQTTQIGAGENHGRGLTEYRIAREVAALDKLTSTLTLPPVPKDRGAVMLLRDNDWRIIGAADLPPEPAS